MPAARLIRVPAFAARVCYGIRPDSGKILPDLLFFWPFLLEFPLMVFPTSRGEKRSDGLILRKSRVGAKIFLIIESLGWRNGKRRNFEVRTNY